MLSFVKNHAKNGSCMAIFRKNKTLYTCVVIRSVSMSYSYSTPLSYGTQAPLSYVEQPQDSQQVMGQRRSAAPAVFLGGSLGLVTGTIIGVNKKPYIKNGVPTDTFTRTVYEKYVNKVADEAERTSYGQYKEVIKKIDKVKNLDELKSLMSSNPEASKEIGMSLSGKTVDEYLNGIKDRNLHSAKKAIKNKLEAANNVRYEGIKTQITDAWNAEKKKFEKPDSMDKKMYKAIKRAASKMKAGCTAKTAAIAGLIGSVVGFAGHKIINHKKEVAQQ